MNFSHHRMGGERGASSLGCSGLDDWLLAHQQLSLSVDRLRSTGRKSLVYSARSGTDDFWCDPLQNSRALMGSPTASTAASACRGFSFFKFVVYLDTCRQDAQKKTKILGILSFPSYLFVYLPSPYGLSEN